MARTKKVEKAVPRQAETVSIYRPGDAVVMHVSTDMYFTVTSAEMIDGKLRLKVSPDPNWIWTVPASNVTRRTEESEADAEGDAAS